MNATGLTLYVVSAPPEFQWAPTLGGECYLLKDTPFTRQVALFQWAPTLGGECYAGAEVDDLGYRQVMFQWAPTLGGECY